MQAARPLYSLLFTPTAPGATVMPTDLKPGTQISPCRKVLSGGIGYGSPGGRQRSSALASPETPISRAMRS
jgi:hypothetical protein